MLKLKYLVFASFFILVLCNNDQGEGVWTVIDVSKCDTSVANVLLAMDIQQRKVNRTQVVFRVELDAEMDIDDTFGIYINACKYVDGGCKQYATIIDGLETFVNNVAKNNAEQAFRMAGIDPPGFPVPKGHHLLEDFPIDFCEVPREHCNYGRYEGEAFFTRGQERVGCVKVIVEFEETDEDVC